MQTARTTELWTCLRAGDPNALKELYNSYYHYLFAANFAICTHRDIVKDSIHEAFLTIWTNHQKLPLVTSVGGYLNTCVRRKMIDALKKETHQHLPLINEADDLEFSYEEVIIAFQEQEATQKTLQEALAQLTTKQKEAIRLRYFENKNYEEIAQLVGCEQRTIYNRVYEAVERLRHYFSAKRTS